MSNNTSRTIAFIKIACREDSSASRWTQAILCARNSVLKASPNQNRCGAQATITGFDARHIVASLSRSSLLTLDTDTPARDCEIEEQSDEKQHRESVKTRPDRL